MRASNSRLLAVGVVVLVVGVALVLLIVRSADDQPAVSSPTTTGQGDGEVAVAQNDEPTVTPEDLDASRLPLPLEVPQDHEAVAVRADFQRAVAAIPAPGDRVSLYRMPQPVERDDENAADEDVPPSSRMPPAGPDGEVVVEDVEVLAVTGPLPPVNEGTATIVVAVRTADVPGLMPIANDSEIWFTLLPSPEEPQDAATEDAA